MLKRVAVIGSFAVVAAGLGPTTASAQYFPGTNSTLTMPTIQSLMAYLGYAPNDFCGFYFFVATGYRGHFSPGLTQALLPMCGTVPTNPPANNEGANGDSQGTDDTGGTGIELAGGSGSGGGSTGSGGSTGGGSTGAGSTGGGSTGGGPTGGGGGSGGGVLIGGGGEGGSTGGGATVSDPGSNPFGGAGNLVTPEPISLILLGTGLAGIGGIRASRRRRRPGTEDGSRTID